MEDVAFFSKSSGRRWAAASAKTLARRRRRQYRHEIGLSRAQALQRRLVLLRVGLTAHWDLSDAIGACADSNWVRHAPLRDTPAIPKMPIGISLVNLELFRAALYHGQYDIEQKTVDDLLGALLCDGDVPHPGDPHAPADEPSVRADVPHRDDEEYFLVVLFLLKRFMAFLLPACLMSYLTILGLMGYLIFLVEPLFLSYLTILAEPLFLMMLIFVFLLVGVTKIDALIFMAWAALAGGPPARPSPTRGCCALLAMILSS
ncbi:unnamed protein product, partial [Prorocentrum cordatum]